MSKQKCKKCNSENVVVVEYDYGSLEHYDGVSEWQCFDCSTRFGRWSGKELEGDEVENRLGRKNY